MLDLRAQYRSIREEVMQAVSAVFDSQGFIMGEQVAALEKEVAGYCQSPHAVGCASGTDALILALLALDIGPGDEVLTVPYSFFATASSIARVGATPVFVDILDSTFNMDPAKLEAAIDRHPKAKAIMPVHLFGACADMDPILDIARRKSIHVIEDAAQAIGAEYKGRRAGSMGVIGCFSFFPSKNLGGCGDGGMLTTPDAAIARRLASLRVHGSETKYFHDEIGLNSRLDALQAAVLRVKLRHLDSWSEGRQRNARLYLDTLLPLGLPVQLPQSEGHTTRHIYNQFVIRAKDRDALRASLESGGVRTEMYYPLPLHLQKCFRPLGYSEGNFPVSEAAARECIALPVYSELPKESIAHVCSVIASHYN